MKMRGLVVVLCMVLAISFVGCSNTANNTEEPEKTPEATQEATQGSEKKEVVELKLFGFKTGAEEGAIPALIEQFNNENADINVTYEGITNAGGYADILKTRLASGQGDDVFFSNSNYLAQLHEAGYTEDLSDMEVAKTYSQTVQDLLGVNGAVPGLPMEVAVFGMYSNMDLLAEVGIEKQPDTYEEFLEACEKLKAAGKTPVVAGSKDGTGPAVFALAKALDPIYTAEDKFDQIDAMNKGETLFGDVLNPGFEVVKELLDKGYLDGNLALVINAGGDSVAEFAKGNVGFIPGGSWLVAGIQKAAPEMNFALGGIPVLEEESNVMINPGTRVCINSAGENKEESKRFLEFFTSLESVNQYVNSQNSFNPIADGKSTENPIVATAAQKMSESKMLPWVDSAFDSRIVEPWTDCKKFSSYIVGGATIDETVAEVNNQVKNNIKLK